MIKGVFMSRRFAIQWLVISILWFMLSSANAAPSALQRISKTAKAAVVSVIAAATIAASPLLANDDSKNADRFLWLGDYPIMSNWKYQPFKELSIAGSTDNQIIFGAKAVLGAEGGMMYRRDRSATQFGYLEVELSGDRDNILFPRLRAHLINSNATMADHWDSTDDGVISSIGYDYLDFRADDLNNGVDGFVAQHLHVIGFEFPVISSSIGLGDIGLVETGSFKQADLDAWAGEGARVSYIFFHDGSLGFKWMPLRKNGPLVKMNGESLRHNDGSVVTAPNGDPGNFVVDFHVKQARTIGGDIDFPDSMDGDFTAIWEELSLQAAQRVWGNSYTDDSQISILVKLRIYRQRINAKDEAGNSFSSRQDGSKALVKLQLLLD